MNIFSITKQNAHITIKIFGIKIRFKNPLIDHLADCCFIPDLDELKKKGTGFVHPIGIVIVKGAKIGNNCKFFQNVTVGKWWNKVPTLGNNVVVFPNSVIVGDVEIGDNCIIGAGSVVTKSFPANKIIAGNPAQIIKDVDFEKYAWLYRKPDVIKQMAASEEM